MMPDVVPMRVQVSDSVTSSLWVCIPRITWLKYLKPKRPSWSEASFAIQPGRCLGSSLSPLSLHAGRASGSSVLISLPHFQNWLRRDSFCFSLVSLCMKVPVVRKPSWWKEGLCKSPVLTKCAHWQTLAWKTVDIWEVGVGSSRCWDSSTCVAGKLNSHSSLYTKEVSGDDTVYCSTVLFDA